MKKKEKDEMLRRFEDYHLARDNAETTIKQYLRIVRKYLESTTEPEPFQQHHVNKFLADLRREGASGRHRKWVFYVFKTFFKAIGKQWPFERGEGPKVRETSEVPVYTQDEMTALETAAKSWKPKAMAVRNYAIVRLANALGPRRGEIRNLNISDYQPPYIRIRTLKGGNIVNRALDPVTCRALDKWMKIRRRKKKVIDSNALFIRGTHGSRLSLRGLNYILQQIREKAGIKRNGAGFHASRRGRITELHRRGVSGPQLTDEWGWKSKDTVNKYLHLSRREVEQAIQEAHSYFQENPEEQEDEKTS